MRKLVIILGMFAVMIGAAVWEIVAVSKFYSRELELLSELEDSFSTYADDLSNPENIAVLEKMEKHWFGGRNLVLTFGNHNILRNADERITALGEYTRQNEHSDAMTSLRQAQRYVTDLRGDLYPTLKNLV